MRKKLTINIDTELLSYTADCFGYKNDINYSQLIEQALFHFLKPQMTHQPIITQVDKKIEDLLVEPVLDMDLIEREYNLDWSSIEGKWCSDESVEQLIQMLSK
jgi:hypothetical protein